MKNYFLHLNFHPLEYLWHSLHTGHEEREEISCEVCILCVMASPFRGGAPLVDTVGAACFEQWYCLVWSLAARTTMEYIFRHCGGWMYFLWWRTVDPSETSSLSCVDFFHVVFGMVFPGFWDYGTQSP